MILLLNHSSLSTDQTDLLFPSQEENTVMLLEQLTKRLLQPQTTESRKHLDHLLTAAKAVALQTLFLAHARATIDADHHPKPASSTTIAIVGCGLVGSRIANTLLSAGVPPASLLISTRAPHKAESLADAGVEVVHDNARAARESRMLVLAVLPHQLPEVARSLIGHLAPGSLLLSVAVAVNNHKLRTMFKTESAFQLRVDAQTLHDVLHEGEHRAGDGLPTDTLVGIAASSLFPDAASVRALESALARTARDNCVADSSIWSIGCDSSPVVRAGTTTVPLGETPCAPSAGCGAATGLAIMSPSDDEQSLVNELEMRDLFARVVRRALII